MKVKCIRETGSKYLIKGQEYEVTWFNPLYRNSPKVSLKGLPSSLDAKRFVMSNGECMSTCTTKVENRHYQTRISIEPGNTKVGDLVKCDTDNLKNYVKGNFYKVTGLKHGTHWSSKKIDKSSYDKVKVEGSNRWLSRWNFSVLSTNDKRTANLAELLDGGAKQLIQYDRKFDSLSESEQKSHIFELLVESMYLKKKQNFDMPIVEFILKKRDRMGLTQEDFDKYGKIKLEEFYV
jgi:hypothetical protein